MRTRIAVGLTVVAVAAGTVLPGGAAHAGQNGTNLPPGANPQAWHAVWDRINALPYWGPTGQLVRDNGFRPFPDGFSFFNMGVPDTLNAKLFGTPVSGPADLNGDRMRDLFGAQVCRDHNSTGSCHLTLSARLWKQSANAAMAGGHCFGMAATASLLYEGVRSPEDFQPEVSRTYDLWYQPSITREIARNMAAQFAIELTKYAVTPAQAVEQLKTDLERGTSTLTMTMYFAGGGHAVTPYALYDRGDGKYDVAIYDNNFPDNSSRAMRLDTVKNTAEYSVSRNPNSRIESTLNAIGLIPNKDIAARQPCPFCPGATETTVQIDPIKSQVPLHSRVTDFAGQPIKGLKVLPPTQPWQPGDAWNFPTYHVPRGADFLVTISAKDSRQALTTTVTASTGSYSFAANDIHIPKHARSQVGFGAKDGAVLYRSRQPEIGMLTFVDQLPTRSTMILGKSATRSGAGVAGALDRRNKRVRFLAVDDKATKAQAATLQFNEGGKVYGEVAAGLPPLGVLTLDYSRLSARNPKGIRAWVRTPNGTRRDVQVSYK